MSHSTHLEKCDSMSYNSGKQEGVLSPKSTNIEAQTELRVTNPR